MHWNTVASALLLLTGLDISFAEGDTRQGLISIPAGQVQQSFFQPQQPVVFNPQQQQPFFFNPQPQQQQQPLIINSDTLFPTPTVAAPPPNPLLQLFQTLIFLRLAGVESNLFGGLFGSSKFDHEDEGWYEASNDCWYQYFTALKSYQDAKDSCEKKGGARLASKGIYTADVRSELTSSFVFPNNWDDPWIGLDDIETEGTFIWSDGTTISNSDGLWPGITSGTPNGDCVVLDTDNVIVDRNCGTQEHYLCEYCP